MPLPRRAGSLDGALTEAAYALDVPGADGPAVETDAHGVHLGDARLAPLWAEPDRRGAVVFVHPTSPPGCQEVDLGRPRPMREYLFDSARDATDPVPAGVTVHHPRDPVDLHARCRRTAPARPAVGGVRRDAADIARRTDIAVREEPGAFRYDMAGTPLPDQLPAWARAFGTRRLLHGSDVRWTPCAVVLAQVTSIDAAPQPEGTTWRELIGHNARRLPGSR
ncbi:hypothetical protein [Streptomyces sp. NPDC040750]|uniref:hypothetical protein n=1 Tax=Streptomyces sp. NPDC040750 TaxID=3154491 RepID=UPI0033E202EA